jgi:hypothetical protein
MRASEGLYFCSWESPRDPEAILVAMTSTGMPRPVDLNADRVVKVNDHVDPRAAPSEVLVDRAVLSSSAAAHLVGGELAGMLVGRVRAAGHQVGGNRRRGQARPISANLKSVFTSLPLPRGCHTMGEARGQKR